MALNIAVKDREEGKLSDLTGTKMLLTIGGQQPQQAGTVQLTKPPQFSEPLVGRKPAESQKSEPGALAFTS